MDSQKKDESRDRRREEALARRMGEALDRLSPHGAGECPDAELISAYHEGALQPDEIAQWESHFATCARCRKILLVLGASVDSPLAEKEVAQLGQLVASARAPREAAPRTTAPARPDRLGWRVRWLAPALGVAAVLAVWFAMRPPWRATDQNPPGTLVAQVGKNESPQNAELKDSGQLSKVAPQKKSEAEAVAPKERSGERAQSLNSPADSLTENRRDDGNAIGRLAPSSRDAESALRDEKKEKSESSGAPASRAFGAAPPPPLPPPPARRAETLPQEQAKDQIARQAPSVPQTPGSANQTVVVTEAAPTASGTGGAVGGMASNGFAREKQALAAPGAAGDKTAAPSPAPAAKSPESLPQAQAKAQIKGTEETPQVAAPPAGTTQTVTVTESVPLVETTNSTLGATIDNGRIADLPLNGRNYEELLKLDASGEIPVQVKTRSGTIAWRAGKGGNIQRSTDAGRTWILQTSPSQEDWLAGAVVSDKVCWIAGRNGAIARTTDGEHWEKIVPPAAAIDASGKLPNWIGIAAASARKATVTAGDQRHYATQDGGKTWRAQ